MTAALVNDGPLSEPRVYPSGLDLATKSEPMTPAAPGLYSKRMSILNPWRKGSLTTRPTKSCIVPGPRAIIIVIGLVGYLYWAEAMLNKVKERPIKIASILFIV